MNDDPLQSGSVAASLVAGALDVLPSPGQAIKLDDALSPTANSHREASRSPGHDPSRQRICALLLRKGQP